MGNRGGGRVQEEASVASGVAWSSVDREVLECRVGNLPVAVEGSIIVKGLWVRMPAKFLDYSRVYCTKKLATNHACTPLSIRRF